MYKFILFFNLCTIFCLGSFAQSVIRINQLGYTEQGVKVAVFGSKTVTTVKTWQLIDAKSKKIITSGSVGKAFGAYGPFVQTYRLNFSKYAKPGKYYIQAGGAKSPEFIISNLAYNGAADFCLRYMRQQRTGFNPYLRDSCHNADGYVLYGKNAGIKDSTYFDVVGGWHDASDYLQYSTTSANATYHLLMAYRDFPQVFTDHYKENGLAGNNKIPDVLDEANWGLKWLLKMFPAPNIMFNQIADDRDHISMRMPRQDTQYGRANQRPVYYINGEPQQRGKFLNNTTGTSSTAAKFASAFSLANQLFPGNALYQTKAKQALEYANLKPGVTQTVSVKSPYIYAEDNWVDDMELANISLWQSEKTDSKYLAAALHYAGLEKITPWLGADTAKHYQWYPFVNLGHYELLRSLKNSPDQGKIFDTIKGYYKAGIDAVWQKAKQNAFYRGIPFIWCSNNLTTAFAQQCFWYRTQTGDLQFSELEQANIDWLFGCNPWGTSMVYGLPADGDTPIDPHSAFTHIKKYPIDGGLVDGPVYTSIFKSLIGITLYGTDEYADFQSDLAVYHDDYGDYSTNEPTMDGTASLIYLLAAKASETTAGNLKYQSGAVIRGDSTKKNIALIFSAHDFADGADFINKTLKEKNIKASFFFTGDFLNEAAHINNISFLKKEGHYIGPHSDKHLLYHPWDKRDEMLISRDSFVTDLTGNYNALQKHGIAPQNAAYFLPPYEGYNDSISLWSKEIGIQLINFSPGTLSTADYTTPEMKNYRTSGEILKSIEHFEGRSPSGLNGFILLMHYGTDPKRTDKLYKYLPGLINDLKQKGYRFNRIDELLEGQQASP